MKRQVLFLCLAIFFVSVFVTTTDGKATLKKCKKKSYRAKHPRSCGKFLAKVKVNSTSNATSHATSKNATSSNTTSSNITSSTTATKNTSSTLLRQKFNWKQFTKNKLLEDNNSTKVTTTKKKSKRKKRKKSKKTTSSPDDDNETSTKTPSAKTKGNGTSTLNSTISKLTKLKNVTKDSTTSESTKKSKTKLTKKPTNATKTKDDDDSDLDETTTKSPAKSTTQVDSGEETDMTTKPPKKKRKKKKTKTTQEPEEEDDPKAKFLSYLKDKKKGEHRMKHYAKNCLTKSSRKKYEATNKEQHKMKCKVFLEYYNSLTTTTEEPESADQDEGKETDKPTKKPRKKAGEKPGLGSIPEDGTTDTTTKKKTTKKPKTSKKKTKRPTKSKKTSLKDTKEEDTDAEATKKPKSKIVELDASVKGTECPKSDKKTACSPTFSIDIGKGVKEAAKYEVKVQLGQSSSTKLNFKADTPIEFTVFTDVSYTLTISALDKKDETIAKKTFKGQKINGTLPYSSIRLTCESKKKKTLCSFVSLNKILKDEGLLRTISADPEGNDLLSSSLNSKEKKALEGIRAKLARKGAKVILAQVRDEGRKGAYESESGSFLSVRNIIVGIALLIGTIFLAWQVKSGTLSQYFKSNSDDPFRDSLNGPDVELGSGLTSDATSRALASPAGQFVEAVLKKKGIPDFGIHKYMKKLADINISSLEQLVALDQKDWERAGFEEEIVAAIEDELPSKRSRKPSKPSKSKGLSLKRNSGKKKPASLARAQAEISTEDEESPDADGDGDGGSDSIDFDDDDLLSFSKPKKTKKKKRPIKDDSETNDWEDF